MKTNSVFSGVIRPLPDELLSSWLNRGLKLGKDRRFDLLWSLFLANNLLDPDYQDPDVSVSLAESIFNCSKQHFKIMLPVYNCWVSPERFRVAYCAECIFTDMQKGYFPAYRKSWIYRWSVVCPIHLTVLNTTENTVKNTTETVQLAANFIARNQAIRSLKVKYSISACKCSSYAGFLAIASYFQEWLFKQIRVNSIQIPGGISVCPVDFFTMVETICLALLRPLGADDRTACQAYAYLPPRKWPNHDVINLNANETSTIDIASYDPLEKAGFLAYLGMLIGVPKCCQLWKILGNSSPHYCYPDSQSLFPNDSRNLRGAILERLYQDGNPLLETVKNWFDLDIRRHIGIDKPPLL